MLQEYNPKNKDILVYVGDRLYKREEAKVSVFDSTVQNGDAVWEGLRVYPEGIVCLDKHLTRIHEGAKALAYEGVPSKEEIRKAIKQTLDANGMKNDTHIRLTLSRGEKVTSGMDARLNQSGCCLIVLAEWKKKVYDPSKGIKVISTSIRRSIPQFLDSKIHHNNLINNILAKIEANLAGVDDALMLDLDGMASETNATNVFFVKSGKLYTPFADSCLPGLTRAKIIEISEDVGLECVEKRCSVTEFYVADEVFTTGTMGELSHVIEIDGRGISTGKKGSVTATLQREYQKRTKNDGVQIPRV